MTNQKNIYFKNIILQKTKNNCVDYLKSFIKKHTFITQKIYKPIDKKNKIMNHSIRNGKKHTSEKLLLKSFKELQKSSNKQSKKLIELAIIHSTPVFKIHKYKNKKQKKNIKETIFLIISTKAKISLAIKFILITLKTKDIKT